MAKKQFIYKIVIVSLLGIFFAVVTDPSSTYASFSTGPVINGPFSASVSSVTSGSPVNLSVASITNGIAYYVSTATYSSSGGCLPAGEPGYWDCGVPPMSNSTFTANTTSFELGLDPVTGTMRYMYQLPISTPGLYETGDVTCMLTEDATSRSVSLGAVTLNRVWQKTTPPDENKYTWYYYTLTPTTPFVVYPTQTTSYTLRCSATAFSFAANVGYGYGWIDPQSTFTFSGMTTYTYSVTSPVITVIQPDTPPTAPTIAGSCASGRAGSFTFTSTDTQSQQLYYEADWNNDGTADGRFPGSGLVNQGSAQAASYTFPSTGAQTIKARATDSAGNVGAWSAGYSVTCAPDPATVDLKANGGSGPITVNTGTAFSLTWNTTNTTSCTKNGTGWGSMSAAALNNATGDSVTVNTPGTYTYALSCDGVTDSVNVTVQGPPSGQCTASPNSITTGSSVTWSASNVTGGNGAYTYSWSGTDTLSGSGSSVVKTYNTAGTKSASVAITSAGQTTNVSCSNTVNVTIPATPTATVTAPGCTIPAGGSSCVSSITWSSANTTNPLSVRQDGTEFSIAASSGGTSRTLSYGSHTFTFHHSGGTQLASATMNAACAGGTAWSGTSCVAAPTVDLRVDGVNGPLSVNTGSNVTLSWNILNSPVTCTASGDWSGAKATSGSSEIVNVGTTAKTYTLTCTNAGGSSVDTVLVSISATPPNQPTTTVGACTIGDASTQVTIQGSDPQGQTLRYEVDWDNNNTPDQLIPGSGYIAQNTLQSFTRTFTGATNPFQVRAVTSDGRVSTWKAESAACAAAPVKTIDLKVNNSNGPLSVPSGDTLTITWTSANGPTNCTKWGSGWGSGNAVANQNITGDTLTVPAAGDTYSIFCDNSVYDEVVVSVAPPPTATITASNCTIAQGQNSCTTNVSWTSANTTAPVSVRQNNTEFSTSANNGGGTTRTLPYGTNTFTFLHNGGTELTRRDIIASCPGSAPWNGTACMAIPDLTITTDRQVVRSGDQATITWNVTNPTGITCSVTGPGVNIPTATLPTSSVQTPAVTAKSEYELRCTDGTTVWKQTTVVETTGTIEET